MDFRGKKYERGSNWSDPEVVELLQLWADESVQMELESCLRNQHVFNRIAEVLRDKGIHRTGDQCREKIKKMKLEYRRIKDNQKTVRGGRTWKFYEVMDRVLTNRPSISYGSLGGSVIAQQVLQGVPGVESGYHLHAFAPPPPPPGAFIFGHPPKAGELMEIKCEEVDSDDPCLTPDPPPEMLYPIGSGDEPEADRPLGLEREGSVGGGREDGLLEASISPSGFSEQNAACSSGTGGSGAAGDVGRPAARCPSSLGAAPRLRKRRKAGRGRESLDEALVRFLSSQRAAEERFLALEECRLQREAEAEQRRARLEQRRAELERQHELRMFGVFAGLVSALRPGGAPTCAAGAPVPEPEPEGSPRPLCASRYLSRRGNRIRGHDGILQEGYALYHADKHDEDENPHGIINFGVSENKLCFDLLSKRLTQSDMFQIDAPLLRYPDWKGHPFLREEVASFLSCYCTAPSPLSPDNVVVMNGCGSLFSCLAAVLCDHEDAILIPTPFYGVITEDVRLYSGVRMVHAHLDCQPRYSGDRPFQLTVEKLEKALEEARLEGINVRALILVNPHNPLGDIYSPSEMKEFLEFAKRHELHSIVDEVYMLSVFDDSVSFHSVLSFSKLPDPQRTHVLWGLSKDFSASGIRVGTLYSENREVVEALEKLASFHGVPGPTQHQVARLLSDRDWIDRVYLQANRTRLKTAHQYIVSELKALNVPFLNRPAGLYIWVDFRKYLREETFEEELTLWRQFLNNKVLVSCGKAFHCSTPGWFRIVFADKTHRLQLGMQRLRRTLEELDQGTVLEDSKAKPGTSGGRTKLAQSELRKRQSCPGSEVSLGRDADDDVQVSLQSGPPASGLDSLIGVLWQQIRTSDWLEKNTPESFAQENPEVFEVFSKLVERPKE
ncbi:1-aminocyclopropane-1-carboxylate synthase-like protein 1 [Lepisosteus oculatus]|uniref:1-aminocyclopropane-1-carboxylate synthase-like protein 1 n=1 Tax=Lepisosteus oculatus TaxID=7918 RepID=UPI0035F52362